LAPEPAAESAPALEPTDRYLVGPGPRLRLVQKWDPPSTAKRRILAAVLALPAWVIAFARMGPGEHWSGVQVLFWVLALFLWIGVPTDHLFVAPERISGMRRVMREVWVRPADRPGEPASIVVDGREAGSARDAEVWVYAVDKRRTTGRYSSSYVREYSLALLTNGTIHLLDHDRTPDAPRRAAQLLLRGLERPGAKVHEKLVGKEPWPFYALTPVLVVTPFVALSASSFLHPDLAPNDAHFLALGLCTLAVRAAVTLERFARANGQLLDTRAFAKTFPGARPAVQPLRWLTPRTGRVVLWTTIAMLLGSIASLAAAR
jgi:hypothetical protein